MAFCAVGKIGLRCNAEVVQDIALADPLLVVRVQKLPDPVLGFLHLPGRFSMAFDADPRHFRTGLEILLQLLEPGVISG